MDRLYEPRNNVYVIKDSEGRVKHIVGSEEDGRVMVGFARVLPMEGLTSQDVLDSIEELSKVAPQKTREDN